MVVLNVLCLGALNFCAVGAQSIIILLLRLGN